MTRMSKKPNFKSFARKPRKSIRLSSESLVAERLLREDQSLPWLIEPRVEALDLVDWARDHRDHIDRLLHKHGAVLLRGFDISTPDRLRALAESLSDELLDYVERAAPRKQLADKVFTSTEYPADQWIPLHHEMSYSHNWPRKLFFCCALAARVDGFTPVADDRKVFAAIPDRIKQPFIEKQVMYVRNYGEGVDMPWREVFQTDDRTVIENYLRSTRTEFEWLSEDRLRTRMVRQAIATHPDTGDRVWFNHAHLFHVSNMPRAVREALLEEFTPDELPRNAFYGDGSPIDPDILQELRDLYRESAVTFPWREGDALILDNFLTTHGRSPYEGPRQIHVAMADRYVNPDFR